MGKNALTESLTKMVLCTIFVIAVIGALNVSMSAINENQPGINFKIDEHLRELINSQPPNEKITVIVILKEQPVHDISIKVKNEYRKQFEDITKPAKGIYNRIKPEILSSKKENISEILVLEQSLLTEREKISLKDIGEQLKSKTREMRRDILNQTSPIVNRTQAPLKEKIKSKGGSIQYSSRILNAIIADIPISYIEELSGDQAIYRIYADQIFNESLDISTNASGAHTWWNNGYNGSGMDAAIVDTGIDGSHPALRVDYAAVFHAVGEHDPQYKDDPADPDDLNGHGTHVAGIVASNDSIYKGQGFGLENLINAKAGWKTKTGGGSMYTSDALQAFDWAISGSPPYADVVSYSFGNDLATNGDSGFEHFMDAIVYSLDIPVVVANGNSGIYGGGTVGQPAGAFNILAVGNVDDKNTISRSDDSLASSSSRGPTSDGRIKPDISAPGTSIMSANNNWETGPDFISLSGTSMATPMITGSVLLILDYKNMRWQPHAIKALILNTAQDKGTAGPDNDYGFGYVNLSNTYIHRDDVNTGTIENLPDGRVEKFYKGTANNGDRATLVWNRHVIYNGPNYPTSFGSLSDLDLIMYNEANGAQISSSSSRLNNIEQVKSNANYGSAILKINPNGTFPSGITFEEYALAADEPFMNVTAPALNIIVSNQENISSGGNFIINVTVNNSGEINAHNVNASLDMPPGFVIVSGANPQVLGIINPGGSTNASWVIRAPNMATETQYILNASVDSNSYGELYSRESNNSIVVFADVTPPASVTGIHNISYSSNYINWTWTDPQDIDFAKVKIYIDDVYRDEVPGGIEYYNATGLESFTSYTIGIKTVDIAGNINETVVTNTSSTDLPSVRYINGTLYDSITRTGISDGMVSTNTSISAITNTYGFFSLAVSAGTYNLTAVLEPNYYPNRTLTVTTESTAVVLQDIQLFKKPTGNISGSVTNIG